MPKGVYPRRPLETRLWSRVTKGPGCWDWTGAKTKEGYGMIGAGGEGNKRVLTHRAAYEMVNGPIPEGLQIDHLCRNTRCCNPAHLEAVTPEENNLRAVPTHCKRGHVLPEKQDPRRQRRCHICKRNADMRRHAARTQTSKEEASD